VLGSPTIQQLISPLSVVPSIVFLGTPPNSIKTMPVNHTSEHYHHGKILHNDSVHTSSYFRFHLISKLKYHQYILLHCKLKNSLLQELKDKEAGKIESIVQRVTYLMRNPKKGYFRLRYIYFLCSNGTF